ncbi:glucosyl-3-phosphoglycerate synthase [Spirochaeta thermophila]|uniref:Glycosyltransferase n=1 Tax=Winmispira thermophila (strain ATCC 49972 / DSM 6192 / RI 19.B1) TaxID=665571 RepID=E0RNV4_WINT6|nr:glucosyl-3-phosphoglycerate synthase [Spirochaeta thermophila]ADN01227.1 glycosyltransferase [Spirochaeta thermophila DSM 6192]
MKLNLNAWIREHTFHHSQFADLAALVQEKERQGLSISLCIPTLNEEKTIGKEVVIFKSELMHRYPLLDEIAVIDSGSTDKTREIAASFGADVYLSSEILPHLGERKGKGENLWKAIYQLKGDIIVYIDADIKNIHPRFVYGLVGPLIYNPSLKYIKAFYDRPLAFSQGIRPTGGGRVTEILVRPLFSLFFPELTAIIQPLSGEYAVRREVLEQIPFPIGYGVETAHLIDVYRIYGLEVFGQTDLDQRVHRNQETRALGKMAFGILQTFLRRMEAYELLTPNTEFSTILRQFQVKEDQFELVEYRIQEEERPPMNTIDEYIEKRPTSSPRKKRRSKKAGSPSLPEDT